MKLSQANPKNTKPRKVILVTPKGNGGIYRQTITMHHALLEQNIDSRLHISTASQKWKTLFSVINVVPFFMKIIMVRPQVVILEVSRKGSTYRKCFYALVCLLTKTKYVFHVHGGNYSTFLRTSNRVARTLIRFCFSKAKKIIVLSQNEVQNLNHTFLADLEIDYVIIPNIVEIPNHINYLAHLGSETLKLLFVGDVTEAKGVPELLEVMSDLDHLPISLELIGRPSKALSEYKQYPSNNSQFGIKFLGPLEHQSVLSKISQSHILVLPSKVENMPTVILEAFACGVPVIATDVGAVPELVETGINGWLLSSGNIRVQLREVIEQISQGGIDFSRMSVAARTTVENNHSANRVAEKFIKSIIP
jgi:glycosyltransferase involved in cell wall biosynthesis